MCYILRVSSILSIIIGPTPPHHCLRPLTPSSLVEALTANLSTLSVEAQAKAEKDSAKKAAKAAKAEEVEAQRKALSKIVLKRVERTKRKHVIVVSGLEAFGLDLKKVAKEMGKKFACGSSVTKAPGGGEEIVIQGDLSDEIEEWLLGKYKDIPEDNIEQVSFVPSFKSNSTLPKHGGLDHSFHQLSSPKLLSVPLFTFWNILDRGQEEEEGWLSSIGYSSMHIFVPPRWSFFLQ